MTDDDGEKRVIRNDDIPKKPNLIHVLNKLSCVMPSRYTLPTAIGSK